MGLVVAAAPAAAHEAPDEGVAAWVMADWMLLSFAAFFVSALFTFVVALKRGWLSEPEAAKYYILTIDEPDYFTPDWAREDLDVVRADR